MANCFFISVFLSLVLFIASCKKNYFLDDTGADFYGQTQVESLSRKTEASFSITDEVCRKTLSLMNKLGVKSHIQYSELCPSEKDIDLVEEGKALEYLSLFKELENEEFKEKVETFKDEVEKKILLKDSYYKTQCYQVKNIEDTGYYVVSDSQGENFQEDLERAKKEEKNPKIYIMTYTLKDSQDIERKAFLSVPQTKKDSKVLSYPVILYAHALDKGLEYSEIAKALSSLQLGHIVAAPSFTGQDIRISLKSDKISEGTVYKSNTKKDWLDGDANELLGLQSCLTKMSLGIEHKISQDFYKNNAEESPLDKKQQDLLKSILVDSGNPFYNEASLINGVINNDSTDPFFDISQSEEMLSESKSKYKDLLYPIDSKDFEFFKSYFKENFSKDNFPSFWTFSFGRYKNIKKFCTNEDILSEDFYSSFFDQYKDLLGECAPESKNSCECVKERLKDSSIKTNLKHFSGITSIIETLKSNDFPYSPSVFLNHISDFEIGFGDNESDQEKNLSSNNSFLDIFTYEYELDGTTKSKFLTHKNNKTTFIEKNKEREKYEFFPKTFLVGTDTGATIALLSLIRDGVFIKKAKEEKVLNKEPSYEGHYISLLRADFPLTSLFKDDLPSLLISGSLGVVQKNHLTLFQGAENFNSIFEPYRLSKKEDKESKLSDLVFKLARMDVLFLIENLKYSLRSWSHRDNENKHLSKGAMLVTANIEDRMFSYKNSKRLERLLDKHFKDAKPEDSIDYSVFFFQPKLNYYTQTKPDNISLYSKHPDNDMYFEMDIASDRKNIILAHGDSAYIDSVLIQDHDCLQRSDIIVTCDSPLVLKDLLERNRLERNRYNANFPCLVLKIINAESEETEIALPKLFQENLYPKIKDDNEKIEKRDALKRAYLFFNNRVLFGLMNPFENINYSEFKGFSDLKKTTLDDFISYNEDYPFYSDLNKRQLSCHTLESEVHKLQVPIREASLQAKISPLDIISMWTLSGEAQLFDYVDAGVIEKIIEHLKHKASMLKRDE